MPGFANDSAFPLLGRDGPEPNGVPPGAAACNSLCVYFAGALPPSGLLERKVITKFKLVMEIAITVTAVPSQDKLLLDVAAALQRDFNGALEFSWLGQGEAIDLILPSPGDAPEKSQPADFGRAELAHIKDMVAHAAEDRPVDWCVQRTASRKKRMLIADMDSTIIGQESIDEMAELKGIKPEIAAITERSMRGELEIESGFASAYGASGMSEAYLQRALGRLTLNPGAHAGADNEGHGAHTVLVSGGFTFRAPSPTPFEPGQCPLTGMAALRAPPSLFKGGKPSLPH